MPGIFAQRGIGLGEGGLFGQRSDDRQVVGAGAAECRAPFKLLRVQVWNMQTGDQISGDFLEQRQVAEVFGDGRGQLIAFEIEAGAECVFAQACGCYITFSADDGRQALAFRGLRQPGDLPANAFEGQVGAVWKNA